MEISIKTKGCVTSKTHKQITVISEQENDEIAVEIFESTPNELKSLSIELDAGELRDFIGALLHVQSKMRGGKNAR